MILGREAGTARIISAASALGIVGGGPGAAHRLLAVLCNPHLGLREVSSLIGQDPGLAARVLKVANSSFYGRVRDVETIDRAIAVLGLDAVRGIAAAACLDRTVAAHSEAGLLDPASLVQHSVAAALAAEQLASVRHPNLASEAFIAALLHDLGATIQARIDPEGVKRMVDSLGADASQDLRTVEAKCVSVGQEDCAAVLFEHWQLPVSLSESARHHHHPGEAPESHRPLTALVNVGNQVSLMAGNGFPFEPVPAPVDASALAEAGVLEADLQRVAQELPDRMTAFYGTID